MGERDDGAGAFASSTCPGEVLEFKQDKGGLNLVANAHPPVTRARSSGPLGALLSSPALDVRLMTALHKCSKSRS